MTRTSMQSPMEGPQPAHQHRPYFSEPLCLSGMLANTHIQTGIFFAFLMFLFNTNIFLTAIKSIITVTYMSDLQFSLWSLLSLVDVLVFWLIIPHLHCCLHIAKLEYVMVPKHSWSLCYKTEAEIGGMNCIHSRLALRKNGKDFSCLKQDGQRIVRCFEIYLGRWVETPYVW